MSLSNAPFQTLSLSLSPLFSDILTPVNSVDCENYKRTTQQKDKDREAGRESRPEFVNASSVFTIFTLKSSYQIKGVAESLVCVFLVRLLFFSTFCFVY